MTVSVDVAVTVMAIKEVRTSTEVSVMVAELDKAAKTDEAVALTEERGKETVILARAVTFNGREVGTESKP